MGREDTKELRCARHKSRIASVFGFGALTPTTVPLFLSLRHALCDSVDCLQPFIHLLGLSSTQFPGPRMAQRVVGNPIPPCREPFYLARQGILRLEKEGPRC